MSNWTYKAPLPPDAPDGFTSDQWQSLSPGMRREIIRDMERRGSLFDFARLPVDKPSRKS